MGSPDRLTPDSELLITNALTKKIVELITASDPRLMRLIKKPLGHDFPRSDHGKPSLFEKLVDLVLKLRRILDRICPPKGNQQEGIATEYKKLSINPGREARRLSFNQLNDPDFETNIILIEIISNMLSEPELKEVLKIYIADSEKILGYNFSPENLELIAFLAGLQSKES